MVGNSIEQLIELAEKIGMDSNGLQDLLVRMLHFLLTDYAVRHVQVVHGKGMKVPPKTEEIRDWFRSRGCTVPECPPTNALSTFLGSYHFKLRGKRHTIKLPKNVGCAFVGGCVFSDAALAHKMNVKIEADHIIPFSKGGTNVLWQFQPLCRHHNQLKGNALFWNASEILPIKGWYP